MKKKERRARKKGSFKPLRYAINEEGSTPTTLYIRFFKMPI